MSKNTVDLKLNIEITDDREIDVQIDYRCWISEKVCLYPMSVFASIYKGQSLAELKKEYLDDYSKDYQRVEIGAVILDMNDLNINLLDTIQP